MGFLALSKRYLDLAERYAFSAEILAEGLSAKGLSYTNNADTYGPFYYLVGHSCECFLKSIIINNEKIVEVEKIKGHDLRELLIRSEIEMNGKVDQIIFWIGNSYFSTTGKGNSSFQLRYEDYKFSSKEHSKRLNLLLKKQKDHGFSCDVAIEPNKLSVEEKEILNPEHNNYWDYIWKSFRGNVDPDFAINALREEIEREKNAKNN
jgi:hypothetical protein